MKRLTPLRQHIVSLLEQNHFLTVPVLMEKLKAESVAVNKTSVYRSLEVLLAEGLVCRHNLSGNDIAFELRAHHHDHLICTNCGQMKTVDCLVHPPRTVAGFTVEHHHLTLYGLCAACKKLALQQKVATP